MEDPLVAHPLSPPAGVATIPNKPLSQLLRRLEAATSRLEDIASTAQSFENNDVSLARNQGASASAPELPALAKDVGAVPSKGVAPPPAPPAQPAAPSLPQTIEDIDELAKTDLMAFVNAAQGLDTNIAHQVRAWID